MAKISNAAIINIGDASDKRQGMLRIPAKDGVADSPGILVLPASAAAGAITDYALWVDRTGVLRIHTAIPTNEDSDGSAVGTGSAATPALDNLASVAINTSLVSDTANTDDLGSDPKSWRTLYWTTSLKKIGTTYDVTFAATEPAAASYTYTFPDAGAAANVMLDTGAANVIAYTKGTSTIAMAANADLDIAMGVTVNIDTALTVNTEAVTLDQSLATTDAVAFATGSTIGNLTLANGSITDSSGAISFGNENLTTTGTINVGSDNVNITLGASGATDSRIYFDGAGNLMLYDSNLGAARSLTEMYTGTALNPTVAGDLAISDGKFTWTDAVDEAAGVFTFANTASADIAIASSITTGKVLSITADACANGVLAYLDADGGVGATGYYIQCYNGSATEFSIGNSGVIIAATTGDTAHKISRNNATGTAPVLEIEETNATGGTTLLIDSDATDANDALQVTHAGTGSGLKITGTAVTGTQATFIGPASQTTSSVIVDGTTGSWIGAASVGMLHLSSDGALANAGASLLFSTYTGNPAGANVAGICGYFNDNGSASGTSYATKVTSTNNNGLLVSTNAVGKTGLVIEGPAAQTASMLSLVGTATTGWGGAAATGMLHIALDGATLATTASAIQVVIGTGTPTDASLGYVLKVSDTTTAPATPASTYAAHFSTTSNSMYLETTNAAATALTLAGPQAQTAPILKLDPTTGTGWVGAANVGAIHIAHDTALAQTTASQIYLAASDAIDDSRGHCLRIVDSSNVDGTMGYPVSITSNDATMGGVIITTHASGTALSVVGGTASFAGIVNCAAGLKTVVAVTDVADPPTQANMVTAFGAAATAGAGFIGFLDDAAGGANTFLCVSNGTNWYYAAKLTVGA